jgi:hypothetical protein
MAIEHARYEDRLSTSRWGDRWTGTAADVADVARVIQRLIQTHGKPPRQFEIQTSVLVDGVRRERTYDSVDSFLAHGEEDVESVYDVEIWGAIRQGLAARDDPTVSVKLSREWEEFGILIAVDAPGDFREFFEAAIAEVTAAVGRRELRRPRLRSISRLASIAMLLASAGVLVIPGASTALLIVSMVLVFGAAVAFFLPEMVLSRLFPPFELLPAGGITKAQRAWRRIRALAAGLAKPAYAALLAAIFSAVIARLFG